MSNQAQVFEAFCQKIGIQSQTDLTHPVSDTAGTTPPTPPLHKGGNGCSAGFLLYMTRLTIGFACLWVPTFALAEGPQEVPLWPNGAPGLESRRTEAEQAKDYWVKNVHNPSITVFLPPKEKATGAGVVICAGGGHRLLVVDAEGVQAAR